MSSSEFVELVRQMRAAQKAYYAFNGKNDPAMKQQKLITSKQLESQVDKAVESHIATL